MPGVVPFVYPLRRVIDVELKKQGYQKIRWLVLIRPILCSLCLILMVVYELGGKYTTPAYLVLIAAMGLNLLYIYLLPFVNNWHRFAIYQSLIDSLCAFLLVYFTGGVVSIFTFIYFALIFSWTLVLSGMASLYFASAAVIFLSLITIALFFKTSFPLPLFPYDWVGNLNHRQNKIIATFFAQCMAFYVVSFLSMRLSSGLKEVKIFYDEILEHMREGLIVLDSNRNIVFINSEAKKLFQYKKNEDLSGKKFEKKFRRREDKKIREILFQRREVDCEIEILFRNQKRTYLNIKTSLLYEGDNFRGTIALLKDLTLKKRLEAMERRALRLEGIEEMALGIAHEIRNPLASIRGCVQELGSRNGDEEYNEKLEEIIIVESDRLDRILQQFLDYTKPDQLRRQNHDLNEILEDVILLIRNNKKAKKLDIEVESPPSELEIWCDRDKLVQVFMNLALNAAEAEATELTIRVSYSQMPIHIDGQRRVFSEIETVLVEFIDNGKGISVENRQNIFTPFFTTKSKGTGLGLSIVSKILKQHHGYLEVSELEQSKTIFKIWLPLLTENSFS